jgi:hypothetical protein
MTIITVRAPDGRISSGQRARLAETLTDAVLVPELGQFVPAARVGFQVHFADLAGDCMAIGGHLLSESDADVITVDIAVMDGDWPVDVRREVIENILTALAAGLEVEMPGPAWWATFRVIDEGSWGARGGVLSIIDLLKSGVFSAEKEGAIRVRFAT